MLHVSVRLYGCGAVKLPSGILCVSLINLEGGIDVGHVALSTSRRQRGR